MATALELLRDRLTEDSLEIAYDNIDGVNTLRVILDGIGADEDGLVVLEISEIPIEEEDKYGYFHFMSVLANKLDDDQIPATLVNLNEINSETLLGSYQIVSEAGTIVHKYILRTPLKDAEGTQEDLYNCLVDVVAIINEDYDRVLLSIE